MRLKRTLASINPSFVFNNIFCVLFITLFLFGCSEPKILDYYEVTKKTPLYKHVTLSGHYDNSLAKGDTIIVEKVFSKSVSTYIDGDKRYVKIQDIKKIEFAAEEKIISETSELSPQAQQFKLKYANYWDWPFWAITVGLCVVIFLGFSMGMGTQISLSIDNGWDQPEPEFYPVWTFIIDLVLGVWYFIFPETTEGVIYKLKFLSIPPVGETYTAWIVLCLFCMMLILNVILFVRLLKRFKKYVLFLYPFYTILGLVTLVFALYLATASIVIFIVAVVAFFAVSSASGIMNPDNWNTASRQVSENEAYNKRMQSEKENREHRAEWHRIYKGERVDPKSFK